MMPEPPVGLACPYGGTDKFLHLPAWRSQKIAATVMGQHYVPRKYLLGFCEPGRGKLLWQYDKQLDRFTLVSVANAANEHGFYSADVESKLAELIENPANVVIDKIRAGQDVSPDERAQLAFYIATMMKRVPKHRERLASMTPKLVDEILANMNNLIGQAAAGGVLDAQLEAQRLAEAEAVAARLKIAPPPDVVERVRTPWPGREMVELIHYMTWRLFRTTGPSYFITTDNPAFFFECYGLKGDEAELVFPIASDLALHGCWQPLAWGEKPIRQANQQLVKEFNRRQANSCVRFVYYREHRDWIRTIAQKKEPYLSRINW